jgi:hypothetical protein
VDLVDDLIRDRRAEAEREDGAAEAPVLPELGGSLKKADRRDYRRHIAAKYRQRP